MSPVLEERDRDQGPIPQLPFQRDENEQNEAEYTKEDYDVFAIPGFCIATPLEREEETGNEAEAGDGSEPIEPEPTLDECCCLSIRIVES